MPNSHSQLVSLKSLERIPELDSVFRCGFSGTDAHTPKCDISIGIAEIASTDFGYGILLILRMLEIISQAYAFVPYFP